MSRLGYHINDLTQGAKDMLAQGVPDVVKFLCVPDFGYLRDLVARNPDVLLVFREWHPDESIDNPQAKIDSILRRLDRVYGAAPNIVVETPWNETCQTSAEDIKRYGAVQIGAIEQFKRVGYTPSAWHFGEGWPDVTDEAAMAATEECTQALADAGGFYDNHEYTNPAKAAQVARGVDSWLVGRHKRLWNYYAAKGILVRFLCGEFSYDHGTVDGTLGGYKRFGVSDEDFAAFCANVRDDDAGCPWLWGRVVYCVGVIDKQWESFDAAGNATLVKVATAPRVGGKMLWLPGEPPPGLVDLSEHPATPDAPVPPVAPSPPMTSDLRPAPIGPGMGKVARLLGPLGALEYHVGPDGGPHSAFVENAAGWGAWDSLTNETVAYERATGAIYADGGNNPYTSVGSLVPVRTAGP